MKGRDPDAPTSPTAAFASAAVGGAIAAGAFFPATSLGLALGAFSAFTVQTAAGATLAFLGLSRALYLVTRPPPKEPVRRADEAFRSREGAAPADHTDAVRQARGVALPRPVNQPATEDLDDRIKRARQRLAKAKVDFGTGKISGETFKLVETETRDQIAALEARQYQLDASTEPPT